jgi:hypothetical protein
MRLRARAAAAALFRLNKDDRMGELVEDPSIGAAFQQNALRRCVVCVCACASQACCAVR